MNDENSPTIPPERKNWLVIVLITLFVATINVAFVLRTQTTPAGCELDQYFGLADRLVCGETLLVQRTVGPIIPWLFALFSLFTGSTYLAGRLVNALAGALLVGLTYHFGRTHGRSPSTGLLAALLVLANGSFLVYTNLACTDVPAALLMLLVVHLVLRALEPGAGRMPPILAGVSGLAACLVRPHAYPLLAGAALAVLLMAGSNRKDGLRAFGLFLAGFLAPLALYVLTATLFLSADLQQSLGWRVYAARTGSLFSGEMLTGYLVSLSLVWKACGLLLPAGLLAALFTALIKPQKRKPMAAVLLAALCYFVGVGWFPRPGHEDLQRLYLVFVPLLALPLAAFADDLFSRRLTRKARWGVVSLAVLLLIFSGGRELAELLHPTKMAPADEEIRAMTAAREFDQRENPGCRIVWTTSLAAATELKRYEHLQLGAGQMNVKELEKAFGEHEPASLPQFVMVPDERAIDRRPATVPVATGRELQIIDLYSIKGFHFYRLVEAPDTHPPGP